MNIHPAADLFPMMDAESHDRLKEDIRDNGQRETIKTLAGQILDGRNRYRACQELGVEPRTEALPNDTDPIRYVVSLNLHRRHLDESQRAMVAGRIANMTRGNSTGANQHGRGNPSIDGFPRSSITQAQAGELLNVGEASVNRAKAVINKGVQELASMVDAGEVSVSVACEVAHLPPEEQEEIVKEGPQKVREASRQRRRQREKPPKQKKNQHQSASLPGSIRAEVEALHARLDSADTQKLIRLLERDERWTLCNAMDSLAGLLMKTAQKVRHL